MLLDNHNSQVEERHRIYLGDVNIDASVDSVHTGVLNYEKTIDLIQQLQSNYGGYIFILMGATTGRWELYYLDSREFPATQPIAYGQNLLDLTRSVDMSDICTAILPLGADVELIVVNVDEETGEDIIDESTGEPEQVIIEEPLNLAMIREPDITPDEDGLAPIRYRMKDDLTIEDMIIRSQYSEIYGTIVRAVTFSDCTELTDLQGVAVAWLEMQGIGGISIECNAADLRLLDPSYGAFYLGMSVLCTSEPHGLDEILAIMKIETDITKVSKKVTVGRLPDKTLSDIAGRSTTSGGTSLNVQKVESVDKLPANAAKKDTVYFIPEE